MSIVRDADVARPGGCSSGRFRNARRCRRHRWSGRRRRTTSRPRPRRPLSGTTLMELTGPAGRPSPTSRERLAAVARTAATSWPRRCRRRPRPWGRVRQQIRPFARIAVIGSAAPFAGSPRRSGRLRPLGPPVVRVPDVTAPGRHRRSLAPPVSPSSTRSPGANGTRTLVHCSPPSVVRNRPFTDSGREHGVGRLGRRRDRPRAMRSRTVAFSCAPTTVPDRWTSALRHRAC